MARIKNYDWTIEVVVENLDIKKKVYEEVKNTVPPEHSSLPIPPEFQFT